MEKVTDLIFGGFKTTADGDCSHEIKRCLLLGRKAMINLAAAKSLQSCLTLATPWTTLSMGFSRHEYWNGLPFPSPRDLPNPGMCGLDHKES